MLCYIKPTANTPATYDDEYGTLAPDPDTKKIK